MAFERANQSVARALALDPDNALAHSVLARMRLNDGKHDEAIVAAAKAISQDVNNAIFQTAAARVFLLSGEDTRSLAAIETALRLDPKPAAPILSSAGFIFYLLHQHEKAIDFLKRAREADPDLSKVFVSEGLAGIYGHLGRLEEAKTET